MYVGVYNISSTFLRLQNETTRYVMYVFNNEIDVLIKLYTSTHQ